MTKEKRTVVLTTRVDETLGKAVQALAAAENRNISNYLETLLRRTVAEQGTDLPKRTK